MATKRQGNWLSHALRKAPWRTQTQAVSLVALAVIVMLVIGTLYLAQATATATTGRDHQTLEIRRQELQQQNAQLEADIAALRSVPSLTQRALDIGFRPATSAEIDYLPVEGLPRVSAPEPEPVEIELLQYDETLGGFLRMRLADFSEQFNRFIQGDVDA